MPLGCEPDLDIKELESLSEQAIRSIPAQVNCLDRWLRCHVTSDIFPFAAKEAPRAESDIYRQKG